MTDLIPDPAEPSYQRLALLLARVGRQFSEVGLTDPDQIRDKLITRSLFAQPLLSEDRPIYDVGSGAGIPALPLALSQPTRKIFVIEPNSRGCSFIRWITTKIEQLEIEILNRSLESVDFSSLPPGQVVSRAALSLRDLLAQVPDVFSPVIKWSAPENPALSSEQKGKFNLDVVVACSGIEQNFTWSGSKKMFHVKQKEWKNLPEVSYEVISDPV